MEDLQATPFYKASFTIRSKKQTADLLDEILPLVVRWVNGKHSEYKPFVKPDKLKKELQLSGKNSTIESDYWRSDNPHQELWACRFIESPEAKPNFAPRKWITELGFRSDKPDEAVFSCILSYSDSRGYFGKCLEQPKPSIPNIIKEIWEDKRFECRNGIDKPGTKPIALSSRDWRDFWARLKNEGRTLPYIYISKPNKGNTLNPDKIAEFAGGNAVVYYEKDAETQEGMNYECPDGYKCYGGAVRVYYPGLDENKPGNASTHRYLGKDFIAKENPEAVFQIVRRAFAQDTSRTEDFLRIEKCREKRAEAQREERLKQLQENAEQQGLELAEKEEQGRLLAEKDRDYWKSECESAKQALSRREAECANYKEALKDYSDLKKSKSSAIAIKEWPDNPQKIVEYFSLMFADRIAFSDKVKKSLKGCTIDPEELWKVFYHLAMEMRDLFREGSGFADFKEFKNKTGIDVRRGEGAATRNDSKLMKQYQTEYADEMIDIEPHVTYPKEYGKKGQSIHFGYSTKEEKIVVGWCGEHLDNYTTQKVH